MEKELFISSTEKSPELKCDIDNICAVIMAGGRGTKLESITEGRIPKDFVTIDELGVKRGIDHTLEALHGIGITDIIYSVNYYYDLYENELSRTKARLHYQKENDSHGLDLYKIIQSEGMQKQYLILPTDVMYHPKDLKNLIQTHKSNTITRGISNFEHKEMEEYYRTQLDPTRQTIVGIDRSPFQKKTTTIATERVVASPIMVIDPILYQKLFNIYTRYSHHTSNVDLYLDIMWMTTELNKRRVERGREPILFASRFEHAHIDFGTPAGLVLTRKIYNNYQ